MSDQIKASEETKELQRRIERLIANQREMDARLWTIEDSRVFRILQRVGIVSNDLKARLRRIVNPGAEAAEKRRAYRSWLERQSRPEGNISALAYQPKFQVIPAGSSVKESDADYFIFIGEGGRLTPNALFDLAEALQTQRYDVLYGDEDHGDVPLFKPDWSPELVRSPSYLGRFLVVSRAALGDARCGLPELAQRLAERQSQFHHVPRILVSFDQSEALEKTTAPRALQGTPLASIVVCSRDAKLLRKCLDGIERQTSYPHREIIVVEHIAAEHIAAEHIVVDHREGKNSTLLPDASYTRVPYTGRFDFAAMNNLGAKAAKGEVIVFLNDDVQPLSRNWLEAMLAQVQRPEVGAVGALLLYPNGAIQHAGIALGINGYAGHPGRGTSDGGFWPWVAVTRNVSAVTGACLAIRRDVFQKLGGFDPLFPVNYNDVDLCLRARRAGYEVILEASAHLSHFESRTRARGVGWDERELFAERWGEWVEQGDPFYNPNLTQNAEDCSLRWD